VLRMPVLSVILALAALFLLGAAYSRNSSGAGAHASATPPGQCGVFISEAEAHRAVWALPRVRQSADELRQQGVRPVTITQSAPEAGATAWKRGASYTISLEEDHQTHVVAREAFTVDGLHRSSLGLQPLSTPAWE